TRVSANTIYTFAATSSRMLEARFALCKYTVIATATTGGSAVGGGAFNHGATVTLTATVNAGYTFNGWYEGGIRVSNNTTYTFTATASRTLEAWFRSFVPSNITSSTFTVANSFISNIPPNINISTFLSGLNERTYIKVFKGNAEIAGSARLGTGMSVRLMDGNTVKQSMTTVVKGDITGDGTTSALGLLKMKRDILGIEPLSGAFKQAADVNGDGKINALDLLMLKRDILGIEKLK
ncbi:MAG: dockerin type I domain-containing protein, partial [Parabacteroides sp.]|nr:dockerin type I domain-containing protein [Parabacteroides sp.]